MPSTKWANGMFQRLQIAHGTISCITNEREHQLELLVAACDPQRRADFLGVIETGGGKTAVITVAPMLLPPLVGENGRPILPVVVPTKPVAEKTKLLLSFWVYGR